MGNLFQDNFDVVFDENAQGKEFHLYECGYEECKATKPYEFVPLDYWVIHYCIRGEGFLEIQGSKNHIHAGDIFVIPPFTRNKYYPDKDCPWSYRWVGLRGTIVPKYLEPCNLSKEHYLIHYRVDSKLDSLFESCYDAMKSGHTLMASGYVFQLLDFLQHNIHNEKADQLTPGELYFHTILKYIHKRFYQNITISGMAQDISIDRTYIFKLFKKYMDLCPQEYLRRYRLDKAAVLLRKSSLSVTDIGYAVGFNTPSHFSKLFAEYMGVPPSQYRRQLIYPASPRAKVESGL